MCQRMGRVPTGAIGLGTTADSSFKRVPSPPQSTKTGYFLNYAPLQHTRFVRREVIQE